MNENISELLVCLIRESLSKLGYAQVGDFYLDLPTDSRFGDLSTNIALQLSKRAKVNPRQLASDLVKAMQPSLEKEPLRSLISQVKIEGAGFINLYFTGHYFYTQLKEVLAQGKDTFKSDFGKGKKVLLEFVSANPTGPLSVAHARQGAVGDSLANIMVFLGFEVSREYYLNDEGNQINILGNSVSLRLKELEGQRIEFPENHYQGEYIYDIARRLQAQKQKDCDIGEYAGNFILAIIKQELTDFGISFDCWYSQKELRLRGDIERVLEELKARGFVYAQEGATWFKSTNFSDDKDRVLIKSDGSYTYLAPDIAYHKTKFERGFTWLINLWGPDHHGYIGRLKASVQALGYPEDSLAVIIVQLASIYREGKVIEMSTRKGQYITLREVLDEVGKDAARFFFLMRRTSSHLDFDLEVAKKQNAENPVYYVQYAHARICSILRSSTLAFDRTAPVDLLKEKEEMALIKKILQFPSMLQVCVSTRDPSLVTVYLQEVSELFHKFYDVHRVLGQEEALTKARLCLIEAAKTVIATGLELLGVSCPEKM